MKPAIRRLLIVSGSTAVILAAASLLLISSPTEIRPPEIRLQLPALSKSLVADVNTIPNGATETSNKEWVATFEMYNPGQQAISYDWGQVATDFIILNRDGKRTAPFANFSLPVLHPQSIKHKEIKRLLDIPIPAESKTARFRVVYWPMTGRDRWQVFCTALPLAEKLPSAFDWVRAHLPDKRQTHEAVLEVPLPSEPEL